jgi:hypothetical protein
MSEQTQTEPITRCTFRIYSRGHAPLDVVQYCRVSEAGAYARQWEKREGYMKHMEYTGPLTQEEDAMAIGENAAAAADFAQPVCECGMLAEECACTDDPAPEIPADVRAMVPATDHAFDFACPHCRALYLSACHQNHAYLPIAPHETTRQYVARLGRWTQGVLAGAALLAALVLPGHASADTLAQIPAGCAITHTFEDASAIASCTDGTRMAFDADGGFMQDHGIVFYYRAPGTWYEIK